jgi:hypothetical protein
MKAEYSAGAKGFKGIISSSRIAIRNCTVLEQKVLKEFLVAAG